MERATNQSSILFLGISSRSPVRPTTFRSSILAAWALAAEGTGNPAWAFSQAKRFLDAAAYMIMIESEDITENVRISAVPVTPLVPDALKC
jgi:hypothetical protein